MELTATVTSDSNDSSYACSSDNCRGISAKRDLDLTLLIRCHTRALYSGRVRRRDAGASSPEGSTLSILFRLPETGNRSGIPPPHGKTRSQDDETDRDLIDSRRTCAC